jgi:hypothetical protein
MPSSRPFPVDPVLTGIAIGYRNRSQDMIADRVLPRIQVAGEEFKWLKYPLAEGFSYPETKVGRTGQPNTVQFEAKVETSSTDDYGLDTPIPISDINTAKAQRDKGLSDYDPEKHHVESLTNLLELDRETRVARLLQDPNTYAPERRVALSGSSCLNDYENSRPLDVLKDLVNDRTLIFRPNKLIMGRMVWGPLSSHPHLVNAIRGNLTNKGIITREELARLLEVDEILVGESMVNYAKKGQAPELRRVWGNSIQAIHIDPLARGDDGRITFGFTGQFGTRIAGRMEDPDIGLRGGVRVRSGEQVKEVICARDVGAILLNAVSIP